MSDAKRNGSNGYPVFESSMKKKKGRIKLKRAVSQIPSTQEREEDTTKD